MHQYVTNPLSWIRRQATEDRFQFVASVVTDDGQQTLSLNHPAVLHTLGAATSAHTRCELVEELAATDLSDSAAERLIETLIRHQLLVDAENRPAAHEAATTWFERNWRHALYYHLETRNVPYLEATAETADQKESVLVDYAETESPPLFVHRDGTQVDLPEPDPLPERPLEDVLLKRRTSRNLTGSINGSTLSTVLERLVEPMRKIREYVAEHVKTNPSVYTLSSYLTYEIYPVVLDSPNLDTGVYHYRIDERCLTRIGGVSGNEIQAIVSGQPWLATAPVAFFFTARFERFQWRYRHSRALRNVLIEAGALGQRAILTATALGLDSFMTSALQDSRAESLLEIDGMEEGVIYLVALGE